MGLAVLLVVAFFLFEAAGFWIHRILHSTWAGPLHAAHLRHHELYPVGDMTSQVYRSAGSSSTLWPILACCLAAGAILLFLTPLRYALPLMAELGLVGWLNNAAHDALHVPRGWFANPLYRRLQRLHEHHHRDPRTNYGVISFVMDRLFGTYRD